MSVGLGRGVVVLLGLGFALAAVLLARLAYDLGRLDPWIGAVVWAFYAFFLGLGVLQVRAAGRSDERPALSRSTRLAFALAIPVGLFGSVFDCMGLSFAGCNPRCAFLTQVLAPLVAALAVLHGVTARSGWLVAGFTLSFGLLVPNCICSNPINRPWIALLGMSPACFASGFTVSWMATSALLTRRYRGASLAFVWGTVAAVMTFFVGHQYFHWPW